MMKWFDGGIPGAIAASRQTGAVFVVYVEDTSEDSNRFSSLLEEVADKLEDLSCFICVKLQNDTDLCKQFSQIYPITAVPSLFFIGLSGSPIGIVTKVMNREELLEVISNVLQDHRDSKTTTANLTAEQAKNIQSAETSGKQETTSENSQESNKQEATSENSVKTSSNEEEATSGNSSQPNLQARVEAASQLLQDIPVTTSSNEEGASSSSQLSIEERVERAKELLEIKKQQKQKEMLKEEKENEQQRRLMGQEMQKSKQKRAEEELAQLIKDREKEKRLEKEAKDRVKKQIEQDRADRAAKWKAEKDLAEQQAQEEKQRKAREQQAAEAARAAANSSQSKLQIRLPGGSAHVLVFDADNTLSQVRTRIIAELPLTFRNFTLCRMYPRQQFSEEEEKLTLRQLELAPTAALIILPIASMVSKALTPSSGGVVGNILWTVLSPLFAVLNFIKGLIFGQPRPEPARRKRKADDETETSPSTSRATHRRPRPTTAVRREGNMMRLTTDSGDDEDGTYNGNSTQQM